MTWMPHIFRRRKLYDDLTEEIRLHIEERTEQLIAAGMSPAEAEREARLAFGNKTVLEERSREVWQWATLESIWADIRFALRQLRRSPGFTCAAILTLALAIGANAVVFGVLNALILRPLAFIVYEATPRDPLVLVGVVVAMCLLGLLATWIPAQRALSVDPLILLREE